MSIIDKKKKIFGNIGAAKTLTDGLPKLKLTSSMPSVNNGGNSITFLTDLIKSLIGYEKLVSELVDILAHALPEIEREIKTALKTELKSIVSCGVDPSIPAWFKTSGPGIVIKVDQIDFFDLMKADPNSKGGELLFGDASTDFNRFLYDTIQNDGSTQTWKGILDFTFNSIGPVNNTLTIKANPSYNTKTLTDLDNNFIDSLSLFNSEQIINNIIDILFGSISVDIKKTTKQLKKEAEVNDVIDCMVDSDADDPIDDSFFTFTNEEVYQQDLKADQRKNGIRLLQCCNKIKATVPLNFLTDFNNQMSAATTTATKKVVIAENLDAMADQNTVNSTDQTDGISIKLNFIQEIINNLIKAIVGIVISPKVATIFLVNYKIIYGPDAEYDGATEFIKANKNLFKAIIKKITEIIIKKLISIALKEIAQLVAKTQVVKQVEKGKAKLAQLLSLVGIPQDTIRMIKGLL
jgi:hypothetical protein